MKAIVFLLVLFACVSSFADRVIREHQSPNTKSRTCRLAAYSISPAEIAVGTHVAVFVDVTCHKRIRRSKDQVYHQADNSPRSTLISTKVRSRREYFSTGNNRARIPFRARRGGTYRFTIGLSDGIIAGKIRTRAVKWRGDAVAEH